jgi:hypothetical protein
MNKLAMLMFAAVVATAGCAAPKTAIVDGKTVPRLTLEFTGNPYSIKHDGAHPRPGGPSSGLRDAGGGIRGRVCGMLVDFDVTHKGDHVQLVGSIDNQVAASIDVSEQNGVRHFTGDLGGLAVDFLAGPAIMEGHVGIRVFSIEGGPDNAYHGFMRIPGLLDVNGGKQRIGVNISGLKSLWAMPPADQAAVLPAIFSCSSSQFRVLDSLEVGFGGDATDRPPETSAVYTKM